MTLMRFALTAIVLGFASTDTVSAQAPSSCYAAYSGAGGKSCCDRSYARAPQGSLSREVRRKELNACTGSNFGDKANEFRRRGGRRGD